LVGAGVYPLARARRERPSRCSAVRRRGSRARAAAGAASLIAVALIFGPKS
jgi:hypothetical protein